MIPDDHYICPLCGLVLASWHAFHQHVTRQHEKKPAKESQ
jgi:uncharacterized C2H2 Zn-finger protein